jgi:hypothetical protein
MANNPKQINHGSNVPGVNAVPYAYIKSLRLIHLIDREISANKSSFHDANKHSEAKTFVRGMRIGQKVALKALIRELGGKKS